MDEIEVMLDSGVSAPIRAYPTDAGLDLVCRERIILWPNGRRKVNTGIHVNIPPGYDGQIEPKSGLMFEHGILCAGTIDAGYTGPVHVMLFNFSGHVVAFEPGQKIAQMVIQKIETPKIKIVQKMHKTERGNNGFGSTGR